MKKLVVSMIVLCNVFSMVAMEEQNIIVITQEENKRFVMHTNMAVKYSTKAVEDKKISDNNALHIITNKYPELLANAKNDLLTMIRDQGLCSRIQEYKSIESDSEVMAARETFYNDQKNVQAKNLLVKRREELSNNILEKKQPSYSRPLTGEVQSDARLLFINRNENYPLDEESIKDYIATFIYQYILARRTIAFPEKTDI